MTGRRLATGVLTVALAITAMLSAVPEPAVTSASYVSTVRTTVSMSATSTAGEDPVCGRPDREPDPKPHDRDRPRPHRRHRSGRG